MTTEERQKAYIIARKQFLNKKKREEQDFRGYLSTQVYENRKAAEQNKRASQKYV
jgi:hypothetical protein